MRVTSWGVCSRARGTGEVHESYMKVRTRRRTGSEARASAEAVRGPGCALGSQRVVLEVTQTQTVICYYVSVLQMCETPTKFTSPEPRPRRVSPKRRGRARESGSRFVDMDDQWTFQCQFQKFTPLRGETSTDETTPNPDRPRPHLGRNRALAYGPVCFPHSGVSDIRLSVSDLRFGVTVRDGFRHGSSVSLACGIT